MRNTQGTGSSPIALPPAERAVVEAGWLDPARADRAAGPRTWWLRFLIPLIAFAMFTPSLRLDHHFHEPIEALNVTTALEMIREHQYLVPTVLGSPRLAKPPATAWVTAAAIRQSTLQDLESNDEGTNERGLAELAWDVRWPACLALCVMLAGVFELGHLIGGRWFGVWSAVIAGTTLLFFKQVHAATIDAYFAMAIAWANVFLAKLLMRKHKWGGWIGSGACLGLGLMLKGPMILLLTVLPVGCLVALHRLFGRGNNSTPQDRPAPRWAVVIGVTLTFVVGFWWYALLLVRIPGMLQFWYLELLYPQDDGQAAFAWYKYITSMKLLLPWLPLVLIGLWQGVRDLQRRVHMHQALPTLLFVAPLLAMSLHSRRYDRYVLPLVGPAGFLAARVSAEAVWRWMQADRRRARMVGIAAISVLLVSGLAYGYFLREHHDPKNQLPFMSLARTIRQDYPDARLFASYPPTRLMLFNSGSQLSIHLNRTIRYVPDLDRMKPADATQVLIRPRLPSELPRALPAEWVKVQESLNGDQLLEMFVRR